jgi:enterobactin synthetase component D / holo-[acyl-carrier protein] synthase
LKQELIVNTPPERCGYRLVWGGQESHGIGSLLPPGIVAVEAVGSVTPDPLFADETAVVAAAVDVRKVEFALGRSCARRALAALNQKPCAILAGKDREPIWPEGITGSITHCRQYCCAAATVIKRSCGIGIDAEILQTIEPAVQRTFLVEGERGHLDQLDSAVPWECVLFSAKEAVYKAVYPHIRYWLDFKDAEIRFDPATGRFDAKLLIGPVGINGAPRGTIEGRFCVDKGRVLTAVVL